MPVAGLNMVHTTGIWGRFPNSALPKSELLTLVEITAPRMNAGAVIHSCLEVESKLGGYRPRCYVVGSAEGRKKVVKRVVVGQVDDRKLRADFVFISV